jgi:tetratricopeptide (TPR) repeat protein
MTQINTITRLTLIISLCFVFIFDTGAQALRIPSQTNIPCTAGRKIGVTKINIFWNAPGVKGREGKIWGTDIAYFGTQVLGFGSSVQSPWRAGADENTIFSVSTDVSINGQLLKAGSYGFFIELNEDHCVLIFNENTAGWGSYFYDQSKDVLRVNTQQIKNVPISVERLNYVFDKESSNSVELSLNWENWKIPFVITIDEKATILADIQAQMSGALGFDPPSLQAAANWCNNQNVNLDQALGWIESASNPNLGGLNNFTSLSIKSGILAKMGKSAESEAVFKEGLQVAKPLELHMYGRRLIGQGKLDEAFTIMEGNYKSQNGAWPTTVGMMRIYSAKGNIKEALKYAKMAQKQAPDELNKNSINAAVKTLEDGKTL